MSLHKNTCPAFFESATLGPTGKYSPCTALGGGTFTFPDKTFKEIWNDPKLEDVRKRSASGEKLDMCKRCWSEEKFGHTSERQYHKQTVAEDLNYTDPAYYKKGPKNLNVKVGNVCNLRCRTCQNIDSVAYNAEGKYYEETYGLNDTPYNVDSTNYHFSDKQLDELVEYSGNLKLIEVYGGEPFLDKQLPKFFLRLIDAGLNENITLKVSTNATHKMPDVWRKVLTNFQNTILDVSVDGIEDRFTYMRHPGKWSTAKKNIADYVAIDNINIVPVAVVSAINFWHVNEVFEYFEPQGIEPFIIMAQWPNYYCVNVIPDDIKPIVAEHIKSLNNEKLNPVINLMNTPASCLQPKRGLTPWEEFKFWTKAKDGYRTENYLDAFEEFGQLLVKHNKW